MDLLKFIRRSKSYDTAIQRPTFLYFDTKKQHISFCGSDIELMYE